MHDLQLVGFTTDRRGLIFRPRAGARTDISFVVPVTAELVDLVAEIGQELAEAGPLVEEPAVDPTGEAAAAEAAAKPRSQMSVRDIQARLRAGESVGRVALEAGVDEEWIERFAPPVRAEQRRIVERALQHHLGRARSAPSAVPLRSAVGRALADKGIAYTVAAFDAAWSAHLLGHDRWAVQFTYHHRGRDRTATWTYDADADALTTADRTAAQLGYVAPGATGEQDGEAIDGIIGDPEATTQIGTAAPVTRRSLGSTRSQTGFVVRSGPPTRPRGSVESSAAATRPAAKASATKRTAKQPPAKAAASMAGAKKAASKKAATSKAAAATKAATAKKQAAAAKKAAAKKAATKKAAAAKKAAATRKAAATKRTATKKAGAAKRTATKKAGAATKKTAATKKAAAAKEAGTARAAALPEKAAGRTAVAPTEAAPRTVAPVEPVATPGPVVPDRPARDPVRPVVSSPPEPGPAVPDRPTPQSSARPDRLPDEAPRSGPAGRDAIPARIVAGRPGDIPIADVPLAGRPPLANGRHDDSSGPAEHDPASARRARAAARSSPTVQFRSGTATPVRAGDVAPASPPEPAAPKSGGANGAANPTARRRRQLRAR